MEIIGVERNLQTIRTIRVFNTNGRVVKIHTRPELQVLDQDFTVALKNNLRINMTRTAIFIVIDKLDDKLIPIYNLVINA